MKTLMRFIHSEEGTTVIEYVMIASVISIAAVGVFTTLSSQITALFVTIGDAVLGSER